MKERNLLRTSFAPAVGLGDFKKLESEDGAAQPITAGTCHCFATAHTRETLCSIITKVLQLWTFNLKQEAFILMN